MRIVLALAVLASLTVCSTSQAKPHPATRSLQDARVGTTKSELVAQKRYSAEVVSGLSSSWQVAPRHASCWSRVPWSRVCNQARRLLRAHRWLLAVAEKRLDALAPKLPFAFWDCVATGRLAGRFVSHGEGGATSYNPTGPWYGRYQMDSSFMAHWGADMLRKYGGRDARSWSVLDQTVVAERGFHGQGPYAWPNTAPPCLSLRGVST